MSDGWEWRSVNPAVEFNGMRIVYAMVNPNVDVDEMNWSQSPAFVALKW